MNRISLSDVMKIKPEMSAWPQSEVDEFVKHLNTYKSYFTPIINTLLKLYQTIRKPGTSASTKPDSSENDITLAQVEKLTPNLSGWNQVEAEEYTENINAHNNYNQPHWEEIEQTRLSYEKSVEDNW